MSGSSLFRALYMCEPTGGGLQGDFNALDAQRSRLLGSYPESAGEGWLDQVFANG